MFDPAVELEALEGLRWNLQLFARERDGSPGDG